MKKTISCLVSAASLPFVLQVQPVLAQSEGEFVFEEIVVYAQRRAESIIDVPAQVSSMSGEQLAKNDVLTLEDMGNRIPNTFFGAPSGATASSFSIRGVGGTLSTGGEEPVALYFDGQYISRYFPGSLLDIESVEVLRGPQATLYGRNATGGAVLMRSKRPDSEETNGYVKAQYAEYNEKRIEAAVNVPVIDNELAVRIAGSWARRDGWVTNTFNGKDLDFSENSRLRASLLWTPRDTTEVFGILELGESDSSIARAALSADRGAGGNRRLIDDETFDDLTDGNFAIDSPVGTENKDVRVGVTLIESFSGFDLTVSAGYFTNELDMMSDSDGTASQLFNNDGRIVVENSTQDIILTSNGAEDFNWIVGLSAVQDSYDLQHFTVRNFEAFGGAGLDLRFRGITEASAYAAFFEGAYDLTDKLTITLGGRYTYEKKEADIARVFYHMDDGSLFVGPLSFEGKKSWSVFKPRAIIDYEIENNWTAYASISTGFKSGGYNVFGATDEAFDDEGIISYEIGSKGRFFDERLGLSAALFYYDYTELQLRLGVPEGGVVIQNASDAEIFGAEAEWDLELGNGLSLYGSVSFLESELIDYTTRDLSGSLVNAGGNNMARAPEFQYTLGADYELTVSNDKFLRLSSSVSHRSEVFFLETDQDADTFRGKPLTEVDIRVTYGAEDESWEVSAFVQNATNEVEVAQVELQGNFPQATFNDPRKAGVEFTRRF